MKKVIDIVEVISVPVQDNQRLLGFNVDIPETGSQSDATAVEFRGWVLGKTSPAIAVEVIHQGRVLKTIAVNVPRPDVAQTHPQVLEAGISGFQATLDLSRVIENTDKLMLYGILRDQSIVKMAEITVKLASDPSKAAVPLPQQDADSGMEGIQLKLQRIQADLERSKVFVQTVKTDLQNCEQLRLQQLGLLEKLEINEEVIAYDQKTLELDPKLVVVGQPIESITQVAPDYSAEADSKLET